MPEPAPGVLPLTRLVHPAPTVRRPFPTRRQAALAAAVLLGVCGFLGSWRSLGVAAGACAGVFCAGLSAAGGWIIRDWLVGWLIVLAFIVLGFVQVVLGKFPRGVTDPSEAVFAATVSMGFLGWAVAGCCCLVRALIRLTNENA